MASTTFVNNATPIVADWLNDVDAAVYEAASGTPTTVARSAVSKFTDNVSLKDFGAVGNGSTNDAGALSLALASGAKRIHVPKGDFAMTGVVAVTLANDVELYGEGRFVYTGANSIDNLITIASANYSFIVRGITFDGDEKIAGGFRIENTAALADSNPVCIIEGCSFIDFKMNATSIWNQAVYIAGSFRQVEILRNTVRGITRAAGTGNPGVSGTTGIYVSQYDNAKWVRNCVHAWNSYTDISGGDLLASANNVDYDAFKFYAPDPTNNDNVDATVSSYFPSTCRSYGNSYRNCRGRAIKIQALANVHDEKIIRDAGYTIFGGSVEINLQYGAGIVRDCEFFYKDYAGPTSPIQSAGHTLISFYQGAWYDEAHGGSSVSGIRVYNNIKSATGNNIAQIVNAQVAGTALGRDRPLIKISDVVVNRGDVDWILTVAGDTGADGLIVLDSISVAKLTYSAIGSDYANPGFKVVATGVYNLDGVVTPGNAKKFVTDTSPAGGDLTWSGQIAGGMNHGFLNTYNRGADFNYAPLLVDGALTGTGLGGAASVQTVQLADDASHTFERRFFNSSRGLVLVSVDFDYTTQGVFACGSNGVYQIAAHASDLFTPSTTGTNTDTDGQLNLWFTGGALNIKNRLGGTYRITVMFIG